jgi:hypothetical protein
MYFYGSKPWMEVNLLRNISEMITVSKDIATIKVGGIKNYSENYIRISIIPKANHQLIKVSAVIQVDTARLYNILRTNKKEKFANIEWVRYAFQTVPEKMIDVLIADDYNELANVLHAHPGIVLAEHMGV